MMDRCAMANCLSLDAFAELDDTSTAVRKMLIEEWGFSPTAHEHARSDIGHFISAWKMSAERATKANEETAHAAAARVTRILPSREYLNMLAAFKIRFYKLSYIKAPSARYMELRLEMFSTGEQRAETLEYATAAEEDDDPGVTEELRTGVVRVRKAPQKVSLPKSTEELRREAEDLGRQLDAGGDTPGRTLSVSLPPKARRAIHLPGLRRLLNGGGRTGAGDPGYC